MRDLILFAVVLGVLPFVLYRPWIGILVWYWIGIMNPHRLTWGFMYDFPVAMLVGAVALGGLVIARDRQMPYMTRETVLIFLMTGYFTFTTFFAWAPQAAWNYWDQPMKIFLMTIVATMLIHGRRRVEILMIAITASVAFYGFKGGLFSLATGGQTQVLGPPQTFIAGNTNLGLAMTMVIPLILVLARQATERRMACVPDARWVIWAGWGGYATFWLTGIATLFTYSRGAWLGLATIGPFVFANMRRKLVLAIIAVLTSGTIVATIPDQLFDRAETIQTYEEDDSAMMRIQAWGVAWNVAMDSPMTGAGFSMVAMGDERWLSYANFLGQWYNMSRVAHSNYFQVLGQHGFVGLGLYLALLLGTMLSLLRLWRRARLFAETYWMSEYAWALLVGLIGYSVSGAFLNLAYFDLFYAFVAVTIVLRREYEWALARRREPTPATGGEATQLRPPGVQT